MSKVKQLTGVFLSALVLLFLGNPAASASIPFSQKMTGNMTWYDDAGYGACGTRIDAARQNLVAVSYTWWTTANPNNDPLCSSVWVKVTYNGKTITVPVKDKCPGCSKTHIDLSRTAFARLAPLGDGNISGIKWSFVRQ